MSATPAAVLAQPVPIEVSAGYAAASSEQENFPIGWAAELAAGLGSHLWLVGELGGMYNSRTIEDHRLRTTIDGSIHSWMFGGRVFATRRARVRPFGQAMIGGVRAFADVRFESVDTGLPLGSSERSDTGMGLQVGGGVAVQLRDRVAVRAMVDYRKLVFDEGAEVGSHAVRFVSAVALAFGPH